MATKTFSFSQLNRKVAEPLGFVDGLPGLPVVPETLLLLELEAQEFTIDLGAMSQLVLSDVGATVQVLRLAGRECDDDGRPQRIEDCISTLGVKPCLDAIAAHTLRRGDSGEGVAQTWEHSRKIAYHARLIAEKMPETNPGEAYLVGLLHGIETLPALLGWRGGLTGLELAERWSLPQAVVEFCREMQGEGTTGWVEIVRRAHHRADRSSGNSPIDCVFEREMRPVLQRSSSRMAVALMQHS